MPRKSKPRPPAMMMTATIDAECRANLERLRDEIPGVDSISAAVRHAARVAVAQLDEPKNGKRK